MNASGGAASGSNRVNRGGSWNNNADNCAVSNRNNNNPNNRNNNLGFRLVRSSSTIVWRQVLGTVIRWAVFRTSPFLHGLRRANILLPVLCW